MTHSIRFPISCFTIIVVGAASLCAEPDSASARFRLSLKANSKADIHGKSLPMETDCTLDYTLRRKGQEVEVLMDSMSVRTKEDGKERIDALMSRERVRTVKDGKVEEDVARQDMTERQRKAMDEMFGTPLCKIEIDEEGKELKRTVIPGPAANVFAPNGGIANTRLFHVAFP